jgi:hypothetical protein
VKEELRWLAQAPFIAEFWVGFACGTLLIGVFFWRFM